MDREGVIGLGVVEADIDAELAWRGCTGEIGDHLALLGIDRYRSESDLTSRERRYLRRQAYLSWLNLLNPQLFGLYQFDLGKRNGQPVTLNASVQHMMAPFGYSLGLNLLAKVGRYAAFGELRTQPERGARSHGSVFLGPSLNLRCSVCEYPGCRTNVLYGPLLPF